MYDNPGKDIDAYAQKVHSDMKSEIPILLVTRRLVFTNARRIKVRKNCRSGFMQMMTRLRMRVADYACIRPKLWLTVSQMATCHSKQPQYFEGNLAKGK